MAQQADPRVNPATATVEEIAGKLVERLHASREAKRQAKRQNGEAAPTPSSPASIPLGVHFGLPLETYLADPAISSSDIRCLLRSPSDYWWQSHMNPEPPPERYSPAL
jgi:hypothetical protein